MASSSEIVVITDPKTKLRYRRGRFLGKGGFAKCYEFTNILSGEIMAGKVVSKSGLLKPQHKAKMSQEISIHKTLDHPYIVKFFNYFEDDANIYIMLELCCRRSLMEMHKRRKALTVPEVRYFMKQITLACKHLHEKRIIHRDLKLGNLFINDEMEIKVGDFGLATTLTHDGERKKTLCGTPNYIAPEILTKIGHSYEVDIWSLGCIMYTLLVGMPPFETKTLKETYSKIRKNEYHIPRSLDEDAKKLIMAMLNPEAKRRPNPSVILDDEFFVNKYIPHKLPTSCLTMAPRQNASTSILFGNSSTRRPLTEYNKLMPVSESENPKKPNTEAKLKDGEDLAIVNVIDFHISDLMSQLSSCIRSRPETRYTGQDEDAQDPALVPFIWVSKWIDYSDKYGLGYSFCDNSKGVAFTDNTHIMLLADEQTLHYIDKAGNESYCSVKEVPEELQKKAKLLEYFITYMTENLCKAGGAAPTRDDELAHVPHIRKWQRTNSMIIFHLTNGTVQLNFFRDHTKIIICPIVGAVSYIDEHKNFTVYKMQAIAQYGCSTAISERLRYAANMIHKYLT